MPKPPIDPDSFDKVNFVIDAWATGCDAPWYIYVETMKPALLAAFITLVTFGWDDVARGYFRPRGLYKRRTGKKRGRKGRGLRGFPEIGEELGKKLPGAQEQKGQRWSSLGKTLWRIDGVMQQVFFWWLVADVAEDFAFNWTSLLYESFWCQPDPPGRFSYHTLGWTTTPGVLPHAARYGEKDYEFPTPAWTFGVGSTGPNPATITATMSVRQKLPFPPPTSIQVVVKSLGLPRVWADSGVSDTDPSGDGVAVVSGMVPAGTPFEVWTYTEGTSFAERGEGVIVGYEIQE